MKKLSFKLYETKIDAFQNEEFVGNVILGKQAQNTYKVLRVFVEEEFRGKQVAAEIMKKLMEKARNEGFKLIPVCSYAAIFFKRYPEFSDLL